MATWGSLNTISDYALYQNKLFNLCSLTRSIFPSLSLSLSSLSHPTDSDALVEIFQAAGSSKPPPPTAPAPQVWGFWKARSYIRRIIVWLKTEKTERNKKKKRVEDGTGRVESFVVIKVGGGDGFHPG